MKSFRSWSRRAWFLHGYLIVALFLMGPVPVVNSYWTDSDRDGVREWVSDPAPEDMEWWEADSDGDNLGNAAEALFGSDPYSIDADYDGLTDDVEREYADIVGALDPWKWDSNDDGYSDHDEFYAVVTGYNLAIHYPSLGGMFYSYYDADGDGLRNQDDSDPLNMDRDGDGTVNWLDGETDAGGVAGVWMDDASNGEGGGGNEGPADSDGDGYNDDDDSDPGSDALHSDWNHDGVDNDADGDEDLYPNENDSHPRDPLLWNDWDNDGQNNPGPEWDLDNDGWHNENDSHPNSPYLWSDWDGNGENNEWDGDEDEVVNGDDSHPRDASLWSDWDYDGDNVSDSDWDGDGYENSDDSNPWDGGLWSDWNHSGTNNDDDWDEDGAGNAQDSHPRDAALQSDWNNDGDNNAEDWDEDGIPNEADTDPYSAPGPPDADYDGWEDDMDSHPADYNLHSDWDGNGINNDSDGDEDGTYDGDDSHPWDFAFWSDFDNDGWNLEVDSDPQDGSLWSDWNHDGDNCDADWDEDVVDNDQDSHPRDSALQTDWNDDGDNNSGDWDEDGVLNQYDSHRKDPLLQRDWDFDGANDEGISGNDLDGDGFRNDLDSHWNDALLYSDWDQDGDNADVSDLDGDGYPNDYDSHPYDPSLKTDWEFDGYDNGPYDLDADGYDNDVEGWTGSDSHPRDPLLHSDWDDNGDNNEEDGDEDGVLNGDDSHPRNNQRWSDWDNNGENNEEDGDEDGHDNEDDSDPHNPELWSDWNHNWSNNDEDGDEDGVNDIDDSHPHQAWHSYDWDKNDVDDVTDWDGDGYLNAWPIGSGLSNDSHPRDPLLHSDWDGNGTNNNLDGDEDGHPNADDSDPHDPYLWSDWEHDGYNNSDEDLDADGRPNEDDSDPRNPNLFCDWNHDGSNNEADGDEDGVANENDSHPRKQSLWEDWNFNDINDSEEGGGGGGGGDTDIDGLSDAFETGTSQTDPNNPDTDGDGLTDGAEWNTHLTNPKKADTDDDLLSDYDELNVHHTNPRHRLTNPSQIYPDGVIVNNGDADRDGIPNGVELFYGLDPADGSDANADLDEDGRTNFEAYSLGMLLDNRDNDGDHQPNGTDPYPNDPFDNADRDGDGILDKDDNVHPWDIEDPENGRDSDGDLLSNYEETHVRTPHTDPAKRDTDGDGLTDYEEFVIYSTYGLNPTLERSNPALPYNDATRVDQTDSDGDGIPNKIEMFYGLSPTDSLDAAGDLDADGISNITAYLAGQDLKLYYRAYDRDADGIEDVREDYWSALQPGVLSKTRFEDAVADADGDGLLNYEEILLGTSPIDAETTDGTPDLDFVNSSHTLGWQRPVNAEVVNGSGHTVKERDTDGDGLPDKWEHRYGAWRFPVGGLKLRVAVDVMADPDGDGLTNLAEFRFGSSPLVRDTQHGVTDSGRLYATNANHRPLNGLTARYQAQLHEDLAPGVPVSRAFSQRDTPSTLTVQPVIKARITQNSEGTISESIVDLPATISTTRSARNPPPPDGANEGCTCIWPPDRLVDCLVCQGTGISSGGEPPPEAGNGPPQATPCTGLFCSQGFAKCSLCDGHGDSDCTHCVNGVTGTDPVTGKPVPCDRCLGLGGFLCHPCQGSGMTLCGTCHGTGFVDTYPSGATSSGGSQTCYRCHGTGTLTERTGDRIETPGCPVHNPETCHNEDGDEVPCGGSGGDGSSDGGDTVTTTQSALLTLQFPPGSESHLNEVYRVLVDDQPVGVLSRYQPEHSQGAPPMGQSHTISVQPVDGASGTVMANDSAGPRYRKIGLNGMPLSDSKPQSQDESGENPEETYIDAYTRQLRHSVSDVYATAEGSLLPLMVRRDAQPECWSRRSGLRPEERPETAFGAGWSSNVCSYIRFEKLSYPSTARQKAVVSDEMGARQTFYLQGGSWVHSKEEVLDAKTAKNVFTGLELTKKFGTICRYEMVSNSAQVFPKDREFGSEELEEYSYARLVEVEDRHGNRLVYTYPTYTYPSSSVQIPTNTLIPSKIADPDRPGRSLSITQQNGVITAIKGPGGDLITYAYEALGGDGAQKLVGVSRGGTTVAYGYSLGSEVDPTDTALARPPNRTMHLELSSITDELGRQYKFVRGGFEQGNTFQQATTVPVFGGYANTVVNRVQTGQPWPVTQVILPDEDDEEEDGENLRVVNLTGGRSIRAMLYAPYVEVTTAPWTTVSGPAGTYQYQFSLPVPELAAFSRTNVNPAGGQVADEDTTSTTVVLNFTQMDVTGPLGSESYTFNPAAGMALASATDLSGNTTSFTYGADGYDDPVTETDALEGQKLYAYDPDTRIMTSMTDPMGTVTAYGIENRELPNGQVIRGLKVSEVVTGTDGTSRSTFYSYEHPTFKGLVTKQWVVSNDGAVMPSSVTTTTLGAPGSGQSANHGWWGQVTQTSGTATSGGELGTTLSTTTTVTDFAGKKRSVVDGRGLVTNFDYDGSNRLIKVTYPDLTHKDMAYDLHGNLVKETNENGVATFHEYDELNRRTKSTLNLNGDLDADGTYSGFTLDDGERVYDGDIVISTTTYNERNQVVTQTDARGVVTTNTYSSGGLLTATEKGGLTTEFFYDGVNNGGSIFDSSGIKPNRTLDPRGMMTTVVYDKLYRPVSSTVMAPATAVSPVITAVTLTTYDAAGRPLTVTDPLNRVTENEYDGLGQLIKVTEPDLTSDTLDNPVVRTFYTHHGKPWKVIDQNGAITQTKYDALGRPVQVISPAVGGVSATVTTEYDAAGNAVCVTDALGRRTETVHDERNRPVQVIAPPVWDTLEGEFVRPVTSTTYDALGQALTVTDPLGNVTTTHYDLAGRKWKVEAPDALGRAYGSTGAVHATTLSTFDPGGLVLTVTNPLGKTVTNTYDELGRLESTVDAEGIENSFEYDPAGNRTKVVDGLGQATSFVYDGFNRLVGQTFANGDAWVHSYNAVQKVSQTSPRGNVTDYTYDARDRLLTVHSPESGRVGELGRAYSYDNAGRLLTVTEAGDAAANVSYTYDAMGRVTAESSRGQTHQYQYDLAGNRTQASYSTGRVVQTTYDALNRPEVISEGGRVTRYGYDLAGRAVMLVGGNGQVGGNTYDALGRLVRRTLFRNEEMDDDGDDAAGEPVDVLAEFSWQHDLAGNVVKQHETWPGDVTRQAGIRSTAMTYDGNSRLIGETIETRAAEDAPAQQQSSTTYTYDAANNRTSKTVERAGSPAGSAAAGENEPGRWEYFYNPANQLEYWTKSNPAGVQTGYSIAAYDAAGNREYDITYDSERNEQVDRYYGWDAQDRLTGVQTSKSTLAGGNGVSTTDIYSYDYRTRRIATRRTEVIVSSTMTFKDTNTVFSGGLSVAEWEGTMLGASPMTMPVSPTVEYTRGPDMGGGVGGLLYSLRDEGGAAATAKYNLSNGRGDIVAQSNQSAALTWTASYEAYGKRTKETGENKDKQRGNSKDEDHGLLNEGFRYRDLETGMWLSRDPAGFVDGPNLYAYVQQNPWTAFDPDGLAETKPYYIDKDRKGIRKLEADPDDSSRPLTRTNEDGKNEVQVNHYDVNPTVHYLTGYKGESTGSSWESAEKYGVKSPVSTARGEWGTNIKRNLDAWGNGASTPLAKGLNTAIQTVGSEASSQLFGGKVLAAGFFVLRSSAGLFRAAKRVPNLKTGVGYDAGDVPVRIPGQWSVSDMKQALLGHPPRGLGKPDIHHGGQMPGGAKHEIIPSQHRNNPALHQNSNQGVTPEMRQSDRQLHWWYRAREQGADKVLPDSIYD